MNPLDMLLEFAFNNIFFIVAGGVIVWFLYTWLKVSRRTKYKVIDRKEVERMNFIESMKFNNSTQYKRLYKGILTDGYGKRGDHLLGKITHYMEFEQTPMKHIPMKDGSTKLVPTEKEAKPIPMIAMIVKPMLFWKFTNPFKKANPILLENNGDIMKYDENIIIPTSLAIDNLFGYYYSLNTDSGNKIRNIIDSRILVTDFNQMASRYYVKGQEQCIYSPELAHQMALKEKELQIELAKRKGKQDIL